MYSGEISFMPNDKNRPDSWHLIYYMAIFYFALIIELIWSITIMSVRKKVSWDILIPLVLTFICYVSLNNPKGNSQELGYIGLIFTLSILIVFYFKKRKKWERQSL